MKFIEFPISLSHTLFYLLWERVCQNPEMISIFGEVERKFQVFFQIAGCHNLKTKTSNMTPFPWPKKILHHKKVFQLDCFPKFSSIKKIDLFEPFARSMCINLGIAYHCRSFFIRQFMTLDTGYKLFNRFDGFRNSTTDEGNTSILQIVNHINKIEWNERI